LNNSIPSLLSSIPSPNGISARNSLPKLPYSVSQTTVLPWSGLALGLGSPAITQASWGPVEPNATPLPSELYSKRPGSSHRNPCRGIPSEYSQVVGGGI